MYRVGWGYTGVTYRVGWGCTGVTYRVGWGRTGLPSGATFMCPKVRTYGRYVHK